MSITPHDIAKMLDHSTLQPYLTQEDVRKGCEIALKYDVASVCARPADMKLVTRMLTGSNVRICTVIGFPHGNHLPEIKLAEANAALDDGCEELDMVVNMAALRSGRDADALADMRAVVEAAEGVPVKVILECHYLTAGQIRIGCDLAIAAGAAFVKTGTGWAPTGATPMRVTIMKKHVGDRIQIKAAGGIRSLDMILEMYELGARRFGISVRTGAPILAELAERKEPYELND